MKWSILARFSAFFTKLLDSLQGPWETQRLIRGGFGRPWRSVEFLRSMEFWHTDHLVFKELKCDPVQPLDFPAGQIVACKYRANTGKQFLNSSIPKFLNDGEFVSTRQ
jgi:hypothetical protein